MGLGIGIGAGVGVGGWRGTAAPAGPNPNLLLWTDEFDNAAWTKSNCIALANQDGVGDEIASTAADAFLRQVVAITVTAGAEVTRTANITDTAQSFTLTGTYDGLPYTFRVKLRDASGGDGSSAIGMRLDRFGGGLRCQIEDVMGTADYIISEAQLEQAAAFTTYHHRGGS